MFTNISWGNYIVVVVLLATSWYLFVGLRFYFTELKDLATGEKKFPIRSFPQVQSNADYLETPNGIPSSLNETHTDQSVSGCRGSGRKIEKSCCRCIAKKTTQKGIYVLSEYGSQ